MTLLRIINVQRLQGGARLTLALVIDQDQTAREYLRAAAPAEWTVLDAPDGLSGLELVRQYRQALSLVILDVKLPDVEGRTVCLRIRAIRPDLPILPFISEPHLAPKLHGLGCLPPVFKPVRSTELTHALTAALEQTTPPLNANVVVDLALEQSQVIEHLVRQQRAALHVAIYIPSAVKRAGLVQILSSIASTSEAAHQATLELLLGRMRWTALVADASTYADIVPLAQEYQVPLVLIAADIDQALAVSTADVACVLLENDPAIASHLIAALTAIAAGDQVVDLPLHAGMAQARRRLVPPRFVQQFADTKLSLRELDILWLDYQGLGSEQIAGALQIDPATVNSHWKRIRAKLGQERQQVRALVRERSRSMIEGVREP